MAALAAAVLGGSAWPVGGAQLPLSQSPPAVTGKGPAPNVVLTVDDSGSMGAIVNDGNGLNRIQAVVQALKRQFGSGGSSGRVPDDSIRLAWQRMNVAPTTIVPGAENSMRSYSGAHRQNFQNFVDTLADVGWTPLDEMLASALGYMKTPPGIDSPWADVPGTAQTTPYLACRKAFHILLTDGQAGRTGPGLNDADPLTLPDGTTYDPQSPQSRPYMDPTMLLADYGFEGWATDLQPTLPDTVPPVMRVNTVEQHGSVGLLPYWNPKNDPAKWQHLNVYTIAFGEDVVNYASGPLWNTTTGDNFGGDFSAVVAGTLPWSGGDSTAMWRTALNSRGRFYQALSRQALDKAFDEIFAEIAASAAPTLTGVNTSSRSLSTGLATYQATYVSTGWTGDLRSYAVNASTGMVSTSPSWSAADQLDAPGFSPSARVVLGFNGSSGFAWNNYASLPAAQRDPLDRNAAGSTDGLGATRLSYLRGEAHADLQATGTLRARSSRLGDFVNSQPWYVGAPNAAQSAGNYMNGFRATYRNRQPMVYIGGNDGMLHGFAASGPSAGSEKLAYIPQGIAQGALRQLTDPGYSHRYFVDGSPFVGDAYISNLSAWRSVLVGTLGLGGRGYFVLDVTDPANFSNGNAAALVWLDKTATADDDIGHIVSPPLMDSTADNQASQIVKLNNGRWAVLLGNGVNSVGEKPVLLVQYLDGARELAKLSPCPGTGGCSWGGSNGLGTPLPVDVDGNGTADVVYAGDLRGQMWRFDLDGANAGQWHVAFNGNPLFVAVTPGGQRQPITAAPMAVPHPKGGLMLNFGTGQLLTEADRSNSQTQTLYGVYDNTVFAYAGGTLTLTDGSPVNTAGANVMPNTMVQQTTGGQTTLSGKSYTTGSSNGVNYSNGARGWYLNLPLSRQRSTAPPVLWSAGLAAFPAMTPGIGAQLPAQGACSYSASPDVNYTFVLDMLSGAPSSKPLLPGSTQVNLIGFANRGNSEITLQTRDGVVRSASDGSGVDKYTKPVSLGLRLNWRERP